jgi:phosphonopyruvate decarboxylase
MTVDPKKFLDELCRSGVTFYSGVPDNINSGFCHQLDTVNNITHVNVPHESHAVALAAGHNIKTDQIGLVYLQNSGLGNIINPVTSICEQQVYNTPCLFLIGLRSDEDQHKKMGSITKSILQQLDIKYSVVNKNYKKQIENAVGHCKKNKRHFALITTPGTFTKSKIDKRSKGDSRFQIIKSLCDRVSDQDVIVTCTGFTSREMFEIQKQKKIKNNYIMNIGGMGLTSLLAAGIADKHTGKVFCLDGDAAILMHMGALVVTAKQKNLIHILFNNGMHESVGKNEIASQNFDFKKFAKLAGYKKVFSCKQHTLNSTMNKILKTPGSCFLEIVTDGETLKKLSRPDIPLESLKKNI